MKKLTLALLSAGLIFLSACSSSVPSNPKDLCAIFKEKQSWYADAYEIHQKYKIPINVAMAIMYHESGFVSDARPPMRYFLFIPYGRASSAYGYAQAQDPVWDDYKDSAGGFFSDRDDFYDALDFICWYMQKTKLTNNIEYTDVYNQYLNYHEGWNGFKRGTYKKKSWLLTTAREVQKTSDMYKEQLLKCNLY